MLKNGMVDFLDLFKISGHFIISCVFLFISFLSLAHVLITFNSEHLNAIDFLEIHLTGITFFDGPITALIFHVIDEVSKFFIIIPIFLEIAFNVLVLKSTYSFCTEENHGDLKCKKNQAKEDVIHLYASHATLFLCIFSSILLILSISTYFVNHSLEYTFLAIFSIYFLTVRSFGAIFYSFVVTKNLSKLTGYISATIFLLFVWPCLLLCLILRTLHLCIYFIYLNFIKISRPTQFEKVTSKFSPIVASLKIFGDESAIQQFIVNRIHPLGCILYNIEEENLTRPIV